MNNKNSLKPSVEEKMAATTSSNVAGGNKKPPLLRVDAILNDEMDMRSIPSSSICSLNHLNVAQTSFDNEKAIPPRKWKARDSIKLTRKQFLKEPKKEDFSLSDEMINESVMQKMLLDTWKGKVDNLSKSAQAAARLLSNSLQDIKNMAGNEKEDKEEGKKEEEEKNKLKGLEGNSTGKNEGGNDDDDDDYDENSSEVDPLFCCACLKPDDDNNNNNNNNNGSIATESTALNSGLAPSIGGLSLTGCFDHCNGNPFRWLYRRLRALFGMDQLEEEDQQQQQQRQQAVPVWQLRKFSWNFGSGLGGRLVPLMPREPTSIGSTDFARVRNQVSQVFFAGDDN